MKPEAVEFLEWCNKDMCRKYADGASRLPRVVAQQPWINRFIIIDEEQHTLAGHGDGLTAQEVYEYWKAMSAEK